MDSEKEAKRLQELHTGANIVATAQFGGRLLKW